MSGILTTSRSLLGRTSACSSHTSFHVGVSYQSRMASPSACIQIPDRRIWGRSADGCSPDLNVSLFGQLDSTMTLKSLTAITDLPWKGTRGLRALESRSRRCIRRVERVALEQGLSTSSGMRAKPFAVWVIAGGLVFAAIVTFAGAVLYLIQNGAGDGVFYSYLIFSIVPLAFAVFALRGNRSAELAAPGLCNPVPN